MMDDGRLKAKRQMFDELEQWARGKSMDKFRPKAVVEKETAIIRGDDENGGDLETLAEGQSEGGMEEPGEMPGVHGQQMPMGDDIDLDELIQALAKRG